MLIHVINISSNIGVKSNRNRNNITFIIFNLYMFLKPINLLRLIFTFPSTVYFSKIEITLLCIFYKLIIIAGSFQKSSIIKIIFHLILNNLNRTCKKITPRSCCYIRK